MKKTFVIALLTSAMLAGACGKKKDAAAPMPPAGDTTGSAAPPAGDMGSGAGSGSGSGG